MTPEVGLIALILALVLAFLQGTIPLAGSYLGQIRWMAMARSLAIGQFLFVLLSFVCLVYAFASDDFSVAYVAQNSNTLLPLHYKITATWGGHEGSLLLWILVLSGWTLAVALFSQRLPLELAARVLAILGISQYWLSVVYIDDLKPIPSHSACAATGW